MAASSILCEGTMGAPWIYMDAIQRSKYQLRTPVEPYTLEMGDVGSSYGTSNSKLDNLSKVRKFL